MAGQEATQERPKRRRKRVSTTRTGCNTCKRRHLKCDEEKPRCRRCQDAGWPCGLDDYPQPRETQAVVVARPTSQLSTSFEGNLEKRSFQYFLDQAGFELGGWMNSAFWHGIALQRSQHDAAIRSALVAVSGLHETYRKNRNAEGQVILRADDTHQRFILEQYTQALRLIRERIPKLQPDEEESVLICCLMFIAFDNLRGNFEGAFEHLQAGLNLLHARRKDQLDPHAIRARNGRKRHLYCRKDSDEEEAIVNFLARLDIQATTFRGNRGLKLIEPEEELDESELVSFRDTLEARRTCDMLMKHTLQLLSHHYSEEDSEMVGPNATIFSAQRLLYRLQLWRSTFDRLVSRSALGPPRHQYPRGVHLLRMQHKTMELLIKLGLAPPQYDSVPDFIEIIDNGEKAMRAQDVSTPTRKQPDDVPTFQSGMAAVGSIYWASIRCPDFEVRRRGIALLRERRRREGSWDSEAAADAAENILRADEKRASTDPDFMNQAVLNDHDPRKPFQEFLTRMTDKAASGVDADCDSPPGAPSITLAQFPNHLTFLHSAGASPAASSQTNTNSTVITELDCADTPRTAFSIGPESMSAGTDPFGMLDSLEYADTMVIANEWNDELGELPVRTSNANFDPFTP